MTTAQTQTYTFDELKLELGEKLSPVTAAYETYGELNESLAARRRFVARLMPNSSIVLALAVLYNSSF